MADIFLSYSREDLTKVQRLAVALEKCGWSVFWDRTSILAGQDFEQVIENAIEACSCMIVVWSDAAKRSDWVRGEAELGRELKKLVPICLDDGRPPLSFRALHTESFALWDGNRDSEEFRKLQRAVTRLLIQDNVNSLSNAVISNNTISHPILERPKSVNSVGVKFDTKLSVPEMVLIPAGAFLMGGDQYNDEQPIHTVNFCKPFALGKYPLTFAEYDCFAVATGRAKPDDQGWGRGRRPVINVSWDDADAYTRWLARETGEGFRLPTESEWEYAVRAGTESNYYWSDRQMAEDYAWFSNNAFGMTHPVGEKMPNEFGLSDMAGNVWEWLQDDWHKNYRYAPGDGSAWHMIHKSDSTGLVLRGGCWGSGLSGLRSAARRRGGLVDHAPNIGFRLAQDLNPPTGVALKL